MKKLFRHIRTQPKAKRDSYALMVASIFTGIVALVWTISLPEKMGTVAGSVETESSAPFASFLAEAGDQLAAVKDSFKSNKAELDQFQAASTSEAVITLTPEEIEAARVALDANAATSTESEVVATTTMPTPVMIATTSATTTHNASSTP